AARGAYGPGPLEIENLELRKAIILAKGAAQKIEVHLSAEDGVTEIRSGGDNPDSQIVYGRGRVELATERHPQAPADLEALKSGLGAPLAADAVYARFRGHGLDYGPAFRTIAELWPGAGASLGRLEPPPEIRGQQPQYLVHPAMLDGCLQTVLGALPAADASA